MTTKLELVEQEFDRLLEHFAKGRPNIAIGVLNGESDGRMKGSLEEFTTPLGTLWSASSPGANLTSLPPERLWRKAWRNRVWT